MWKEKGRTEEVRDMAAEFQAWCRNDYPAKRDRLLENIKANTQLIHCLRQQANDQNTVSDGLGI